ncbi:MULTISPECIES: ABC-type transport auxiliary lipoprotein family protein [unclassified Janthinobacterium]|uniref:ABC-type transport auxiliary lipoprotein family protein n=1 Tax=unclassified Janthinobacterium TaxID=2610881 RepID=UPI00161DC9CA|nr:MULTISPECIES: ABC-type transport auxiliary lipoprotein family protein [unclassified Janthinobacterium]MBB5608064.1 cholesterol transport system auxiliary component [Janthinobacterium sp. S3T4]MBB5613390.1 cholesterol transport system auxiliary component [Janthinobacterium sp. S3M3]
MSISRPVTLLTLSTALLLGGCASRGPLPTFYDFGPAGISATQQAAPPLPVLVIADANGPSWLDSQRMYYRLLYADAQQSRPYAYNRWNTPPLQLLSQRLKTRIAQGGVKVLSTTDAASGIPLLRIDVDDFSQNFDTQTQSSGHVSLRASLFRGHRLIDQKTFSRSSDARSADAQGGAQALASASDAVATDLLTWLGTLNIPKE